MFRIIALIISVLFFTTVNSIAQKSSVDSASANSVLLKVFLNGVPDWQNYMKVKLWYADYLRDPALAQVQVIISMQPTASGGSLYHLFFIGRENFKGKNDTLTYTAPIENTNRQTRDELTSVIAMGLMPYFALNGQQKYFIFDYNDVQEKIKKASDKWKYWVFTLQASPNLTVDQGGTALSGSASASASHVTDEWKLRMMSDAVIDYSKFKSDTLNYESTELIKHANILLVESINEHWSWGAEAGFYTSTFSNIQSQFSWAPGIEYDVFPYSESINHILTFKYRLKPLYNFYSDTTIYNKENEFLLNQILDATYTRIEKWGNFSTTLTTSEFLDHPKQFRFDITGQMDFRLAQGLFLNFIGNFSYIKNQRSISNAGLTPEEIILQHKEILTNYSYGLQVGITYTFGAIYNNIVNPRYESGITIDPEVADILGN